ncbi:DUF6193 family natural product biosynthesis protein [Kitasatospora sp. NPDC056138]|uniref:DUF6193 family natural product biosynthesis protein n=1 Tax=Kitasatospora sp. NPDC056138 TaxID=3345724 RepID=UPI0035DB7969
MDESLAVDQWAGRGSGGAEDPLHQPGSGTHPDRTGRRHVLRTVVEPPPAGDPPAGEQARALLEAAHAEPKLRQLYPFTSHHTLCLSSCPTIPYIVQVPSVDPLRDGRFRIRRPRSSSVIGYADTPEDAISLVTAHPPAGPGASPRPRSCGRTSMRPLEVRWDGTVVLRQSILTVCQVILTDSSRPSTPTMYKGVWAALG